jgi:hypothetical protein
MLLCIHATCLANASERAITIRFETTDTCNIPYYYHPSSQSTLYGEAFEWNKQAHILQWHYTAIAALNTTTIEGNPFNTLRGDWDCAQISYNTVVIIPHALHRFSTFTRLNKFEMHAVKTVCMLGDTVLSSVTLSNVPFCQKDVQMFSKMDFAKGVMHTTAQIKYEIPWYLSFLGNMSRTVAIDSFMYSIKSSKHQLCVPSIKNAPPKKSLAVFSNI